MAIKLVYATGDDFKWKERSELAMKFDVVLERMERMDLGRRIEMLGTLEEAAIFKWKLASKKTQDWVMVDMNDVMVTNRKSWYQYRQETMKTQKEFVDSLWLPEDGKTADLVKVGLKNVLVFGRSGTNPMVFEELLDGVIMYRPPQRIFANYPPIIPFIYVTIWQEMLDQTYQVDWKIRSSSRITHDAKTLIQVINRIH